MWTKAIIVSIHKKGDTIVRDNYRGLSLLSLIGNCYTTILNNYMSGLKTTKSQKLKQDYKNVCPNMVENCMSLS